MSKNVHLTSGPIMPQLFRLCVPLLIGNVLQQLYNIINSLIVTRYLGSGAFAALGVAETIMNLFIYCISGACTGASVLIARDYGEGDRPKLRRQMYVTFVIIGGCTLAAVAVGQIFLPALLKIMNTPAELMGYVSTYLRCILVGMLFTFTYNFLASALRAVGNTRVALYFLLISLGYNIVAAWLLVAHFNMGIFGTALATATAQFISTALCFIYILKKQPFLIPGFQDMRLSVETMRETASFGVIAALHQSSLHLGKMMIQSAINTLGTAAISGFAAATRVENFVQAFGMSGSETLSIFIAQNKGAKQPERANSGFKKGFAVMLAAGAISTVLLVCFARSFAAPFLDANDYAAIEYAVDYLFLLGFFYILSFVGHSFVGYFRGSGRMNIPFWGTTIQIAVRVVGTYLLIDRMALDATALATGIGWVVIVIFHGGNYLAERYHFFPLKRKNLPEAEANHQ